MMRRNESGFVSLMTCIMLSLLLLVITLSMASIQSLQLRKAEDSEQTLRAYYSAEAGVEDAVSKVLSKTISQGVGDNTCHASSGFDAPGAAEWTCQYVSFSGNPTGKLDKADSAKTVDPLHTATPYRSVIIEWNQSTNTTAAYHNRPTLLTGSFPTQAAYNGSPFDPPLELAVLEYPGSGFASNQVCTRPGVPAGCQALLQNLVIVPNGGAGSIINYAALLGHGPWSGNCGNLGRNYTVGGLPLTGYNCYAVLNNVNTAKDYLFRIRSRYSASAYRLTFRTGPNGMGSTVSVPDGTATIDVTARAGQTFRRVISKLPLNQSAASMLNFVIYSDTDVCKNFDVIDNVPSAPPAC
jgi:Tfp pilus assembly protein PilX